jgi:hypothetical protein
MLQRLHPTRTNQAREFRHDEPQFRIMAAEDSPDEQGVGSQYAG